MGSRGGIYNDALDVPLQRRFAQSLPIHGCNPPVTSTHGNLDASPYVPLLFSVSKAVEDPEKTESRDRAWSLG